MQTHNLGYPRIGSNRELKKACEQYWAGKIEAAQLEQVAREIRSNHWQLQKDAGIDWIPVNDFSFYDQVLDTCLMTGAIPERYHPLIEKEHLKTIDLLFAMARGYQKNGYDLTAMEMTKWFDTNYHYIVPEFKKDQKFSFFNSKVTDQFIEAKKAGYNSKPVLTGPVTFLLLGKEKEEGFHRIDLLKNLLPVYFEVLEKLDASGAYYVQLDEPCLTLDLTQKEQQALVTAYTAMQQRFPNLKIILANYFDCFGANLSTALSLPVQVLHLDLVRCPSQLEDILAVPDFIRARTHLSLGIVDGRNIWKNNFKQSLSLIQKAQQKIGADRIWLAPSCSLLHTPCDLDLETDERHLTAEIKQWMAFAQQKLAEVASLKQIAADPETPASKTLLEANIRCIESRRSSALIHNQQVKQRVAAITEADARRNSSFTARKEKQQQEFRLPLFPTTTIGSFPQTKEIRAWRAQWKKQQLSDTEYDRLLKEAAQEAIRWQEEAGLDVLVHGEFERNDMVEYFGEQLAGFAFTQNGWVQSYGSRCVKPPVIYGDIYRPAPMTVEWSRYAQSLTRKWVKGMLTGPVTILQWSFVRDDQPRSVTGDQIALAIRDEVIDLEKAGIKIIQIDEPAIREGLPLRKENRREYLDWAVRAFRIAASGVQDATQIHTHMCYSEFNDIINNIADMDADVITIETSRSQMELLDAFATFAYPNDIGPGVYDIHSPRVPSKQEMVALIEKALHYIPAERLWVNPDCGLKTRGWKETKRALTEMVNAAKTLREKIQHPVLQ
ncbi:5-methyltetrahydropteroyltriglutamate--homocysteine S-methyltransferase [Niabella ginsenosidivorans]|uniref:5-methyltetrahydropteroyltriglutamate--homocysteine methyltransferase n=1 Tax=Niabella ginsenosidivorans TaxID=1176587 RepID=A0A1A9I8Z3_9BACT|nr:5-methyltetrahydropteroyltriglutamate--homocysteine S-methyltransferase [Niabella ginsenosidivorans]ANH82994.1 5-methyltetrahydropteroyltriglutamate--homocysteine S-methyltransferase [Niabella ginsenosidivorans]